MADTPFSAQLTSVIAPVIALASLPHAISRSSEVLNFRKDEIPEQQTQHSGLKVFANSIILISTGFAAYTQEIH